MKKKLLAALSLSLALAMTAGTLALAGCAPDEPEPQPQPELNDPALDGDMLADFTAGESEAFLASDGWTNGSVFNTQWSANNYVLGEDSLKLTIDENPNGAEETNNEYFGGEARTHQWFGYGDFEVRMKPAKKAGTASTFFTCTGNYDTNLEGEPNPWDEIDIEFLGQDTTKVQFNYYVNGVGGHEYMYDLGFDASEEFHNYGFRWTEDYICWFVDGEPVYKVEASADSPMPAAAGRILMNYWCGTTDAEGWMGAYSDPGDEGPEYEWVKTSGEVYKGEIPEPVVVEEFEGDWADYEAQAVTFETSENLGSPAYTFEQNGTSTDITYTQAGGYDNANFDCTDIAADTNWLHMTMTNNGDATVNSRINVRTGSDPSSLSTTNSYGFGNGELLRTNAGEGTFVDIPAGETIEVEIRFAGNCHAVEVMLDSMQAAAVTKAGDVTISDIKFAKQGEIEIPEEQGPADVVINGETIRVEGNLGAASYLVSVDENNAMNVTYSTIAGASYHNVSMNVAAAAAGSDTFTATVTNNGTEAVTLRVDVLATEKVNDNTNACNLSATMDGAEVYTDLEWGGSTFTIEAGKTVNIAVVFDATKTVQSLQMMFDSSVYNDTATHSGDLTVAGMAFAKAE